MLLKWKILTKHWNVRKKITALQETLEITEVVTRKCYIWYSETFEKISMKTIVEVHFKIKLHHGWYSGSSFFKNSWTVTLKKNLRTVASETIWENRFLLYGSSRPKVWEKLFWKFEKIPIKIHKGVYIYFNYTPP